MGYALGYGEGQPMRLSGTMVWVLPEYHYTDGSERTAIEGPENILTRRMYSMVGPLLHQEFA